MFLPGKKTAGRFVSTQSLCAVSVSVIISHMMVIFNLFFPHMKVWSILASDEDNVKFPISSTAIQNGTASTAQKYMKLICNNFKY